MQVEPTIILHRAVTLSKKVSKQLQHAKRCTPSILLDGMWIGKRGVLWVGGRVEGVTSEAIGVVWVLLLL